MNRQGEQRMGRISVEVDLANYGDVIRAREGTLSEDKVRRIRLQGLVDTGAARLVLPQKVVQELGLPAAGESKVRYADQRTANRTRVQDVWLKLQDRASTFSAIVEPDRSDALIGAIVLEELDFVVDCTTQRLHPRDPDRIVSEIE